MGHFCPPGSGTGIEFRIWIRIRIPNPDTDPLTRLNPDTDQDPQPCRTVPLTSPVLVGREVGLPPPHLAALRSPVQQLTQMPRPARHPPLML